MYRGFHLGQTTRKRTDGSGNMDFLQMYRVRQVFPSRGLPAPGEAIKAALANSALEQNIKPGMKVGITAGSRGIRDIVPILRETTSYVKDLGGIPVLLAAMGSHGGGCPSGQRELLCSLGITEESVGAALICSSDYIIAGRAFYGEVYLNRCVLECDALIVVNRIRPHTSFHGNHESGLLKMLAVGLGGPPGAASLHRCRPELISRAVAEGGQTVLKVAPVVLGLAILEDAYKQTAKVAAICPEDFMSAEKSLLEEARQYLPGLPVEDLDVLIVDEIGKNISGTGMDTNVIGRLRIQGVPEPPSPRIKRILALDVAREANGNAYGIGLADFTTERLVSKLDRNSTYTNALASTFVQRAMIPMTLPNDREALLVCLNSLGLKSLREARLIRIQNTLQLSEILISETVFRDIANLPFILPLGQPESLQFSGDGNLLPF